MDQIMVLVRLIVDILIQLLTYVKEGLEIAYRLFVQLVSNLF